MAATMAPSSGSSSPPSPECRLCLDAVLDCVSAAEARLAHPCNCCAPVHIGCLRRWHAAQLERACLERHSRDEHAARAATCEICGARLVFEGSRAAPLARTATCRAPSQGTVALRRIPTLSRAWRNFSEYAAVIGQELEVLEQDASGEFFRVRVRNAQRYRECGSTSVAEGWIRHIYLEWPTNRLCAEAKASFPAPRVATVFVMSHHGPVYDAPVPDELISLVSEWLGVSGIVEGVAPQGRTVFFRDVVGLAEDEDIASILGAVSEDTLRTLQELVRSGADHEALVQAAMSDPFFECFEDGEYEEDDLESDESGSEVSREAPEDAEMQRWQLPRLMYDVPQAGQDRTWHTIGMPNFVSHIDHSFPFWNRPAESTGSGADFETRTLDGLPKYECAACRSTWNLEEDPNNRETLYCAACWEAWEVRQKQDLGERLYLQVAALQPQLAGKITGMLLENDSSMLARLLESFDELSKKVKEALAILASHGVEAAAAAVDAAAASEDASLIAAGGVAAARRGSSSSQMRCPVGWAPRSGAVPAAASSAGPSDGSSATQVFASWEEPAADSDDDQVEFTVRRCTWELVRKSTSQRRTRSCEAVIIHHYVDAPVDGSAAAHQADPCDQPLADSENAEVEAESRPTLAISTSPPVAQRETSSVPWHRAAAVDAWEQQLADRTAAVFRREAAVALREAELAEQEAALLASEQALRQAQWRLDRLEGPGRGWGEGRGRAGGPRRPSSSDRIVWI